MDHLNCVYVSLPDPIIISNEIVSAECEEQNNIFNPVSCDTANVMLERVKQEQLSIAIEEKDLYGSVEENAKKLIEEKLASFGDYKIIFY